MFRKFEYLVKNKSDYLIINLHKDKGGEFPSNDFENLCEANGTCKQLITSYSLQRNNIAKYKNKSSIEMAKGLSKGMGLPNKFWAKIVFTSAYILNRCHASSLKDITLYKAWIGCKPQVNHFKVFSCLAYIHVPC